MKREGVERMTLKRVRDLNTSLITRRYFKSTKRHMEPDGKQKWKDSNVGILNDYEKKYSSLRRGGGGWDIPGFTPKT